MTQNGLWIAALVMLCGMAPAVYAAEESAAAPASSTSVPTPQITSAEGAIASIDAQSVSPSLKLTAADGKTWTLTLDAKTTSVWNRGQLSRLETLKTGDQVKVRYMVKEGRNWAKSIEIVPATPSAAAMPAPTTLPATSSETTRQ